jgi:hypothetical protein
MKTKVIHGQDIVEVPIDLPKDLYETTKVLAEEQFLTDVTTLMRFMVVHGVTEFLAAKSKVDEMMNRTS